MADVLERQAMQHLLKWGIGILGMLIVAGAGSLATQNVYSKTEVDEKCVHIQENMTSELGHVREVQTIQYKHANEQLQLIRDDMGEIKEMIKDSQ